MNSGFEPQNIGEAQCVDGDLGATPIPTIFASILNERINGRLSVQSTLGEYSLFFVNGNIMGAVPAAQTAPLGRMLLELGHIRSAEYVFAERSIQELRRDEEHVYREVCSIEENKWARVLSLQTHHYVQEIVGLREGAFSFCRGLSFVSGFAKAPVKTSVAIFLAQREHIDANALELWVDELEATHVKASGTPAPIEDYELDIAEARFLERLTQKFQSIQALTERSALTKSQVGLFLFHLERTGFLELQSESAPPTPEPEPVEASAFAAQVTDPNMHAPVSKKVQVKTPAKKRRRGRRTEPEPSSGVSAVSDLRIEKEPVTVLPSIVIEGLDD